MQNIQKSYEHILIIFTKKKSCAVYTRKHSISMWDNRGNWRSAKSQCTRSWGN